MSVKRYKAVIFDRDGTLNRTTDILRAGQPAGAPTDGYVLAPDEIELIQGVLPALTTLRAAGIACFVFTQQNCISKGLLSTSSLDHIHQHLNELVDGAITAFHTATSHNDPKAKPGPVMINDIMAAHNLQHSDVLVVGDSLRDYLAAKAAQVDFIWVRDGKGRVSEHDMAQTDCPVFDDVAAVVRHLMDEGLELTDG